MSENIDQRVQPAGPAGAGAEAPSVRSPVLCVDMDGTLLRTDSLHEGFFAAIKRRPLALIAMARDLLGGRLSLKRAVTREARGLISLDACPRQPEVVALAERARQENRRVELVSAADQGLLNEQPWLRTHFDEVIGSSGDINLKGEEKARLLKKRHPGGFAYVGNSFDDLAVWRAAEERYGVNLSERTRRQAAREGLGVVELARPAPLWPAVRRSMRLHQWLKNLLIFVPMVLALPSLTSASIGLFGLGFLLLGLLTSGTYLINDIFDVAADRRHHRKRRRPIASGDLPIGLAAIVGLGLIGTALIGGFVLKPALAGVLAAYLVLTLTYSVHLKQMAMVDVLTIAVLFTLRIVAGAVLIGRPVSQWLVIFSVFLFTSLALMKREVELNALQEAGRSSLQGRGYALDDRVFVLALGLSTCVASLVVFALFISAMDHPDMPYRSPVLLWGAMAALSYWLIRMWLITTRGLMDDDPILYAARDRTSLILGAVTAISVLAARYVPL